MRLPARSVLLPLAVVLLAAATTGCAVTVVDPESSPAATSAGPTSSANGDMAPPTPGAPAPTSPAAPVAPVEPTGYGSAIQDTVDEALAAVTLTAPCSDTLVLDQTAAIIRVEGACPRLTLHLDAGIVIADDVGELLLTGSGSVVFVRALTTLQVSGDVNEVYWQGSAPTVTDSGDGNVLTRG